MGHCDDLQLANILKMAVQNGIINLDSIKSDLEKMNKEKIVNQFHKYTISERTSKNGKYEYRYWFTYVPDEKAKSKRKLLKRNSREALIDALFKYYNGTSEDENKDIITFKTEYDSWLEFKKKLVSVNTIRRYKTDYTRFFEKSEFIRKNIQDITTDDIITFLSENVKSKKLDIKAFVTLNGYVREVIEFAFNKKHIDSDPYSHISSKLKLVKKQCVKKVPKMVEERTISDKEIKVLLQELNKSYKNKPEYITAYAVEFAIYTGCRVGEIAALRWSDICEDKIVIKHSEKALRGDNGITYSIESTKTGKIRTIPLVDAVKKLLNRVKKAELAIGSFGEFVFSDKKGRIKAARISDCIQNKSVAAGIDKKSINDCRRTVNSKLKSFGLDDESAAAMLGHTTKVNLSYYSYDVSDLDKKYEYLNKVCSEISQ